ncbi:thiol reductant ABC exporter subunit CydD [Metallibacterium sp.]|uniref:thiol reductant ABC exporter subunit CydD n=1 Tax=Metallibacterium sp. TaxID=2940281 RepID=UPI002606A8D6|nr:thiol reductant ABC exporter subunit CydD [Metallibacterium sp.]
MQAANWLRREARRIRKPLQRSALATALQALALVAQAWLLADILDAALFRHAPLAQLWPQWWGLLLLAPLRLLLNLYARRTAFAAGLDLSAQLRARLLTRAQALGPLGLRAQASGDLITRLVDGVDAVLPYFVRYLPQVSTAALVPLLLALFVFPADWISGLILLLTAPLIPFFIVLVGNAAERASRQRYAQLTRLGAAFMDALGGLSTLRQLGAAERVAQRLDTDGEDYRQLTMQVLRVAFLSALVLEFFATVSIAVVAVLIGFRLLWHELPFHDGLFVLLLAPEFYLPLRALGTLRHARMDALAAAQQMAVLDDAPPQASAPLAGGHHTPPDHAPGVRIDNVNYVHAGRAAALRECSFELQPRRVTALVGATGSGKSTLLNLLLGFAPPESGRVLIDGIDLANLDMTQWRARIAWVPQQTHIFEGSVRDNLLLAAPRADAEALQRAAADSGLDAVIARLPRGWDTPLGEHGLGLSGGEIQRLALARALLREHANVWLLDEPTAHLDADSAQAVERVIRTAAATRTVLLVAHRLASAQAADRVVVLRDGRVVEQGAPRELMRAQGAYAALLQAEAQ